MKYKVGDYVSHNIKNELVAIHSGEVGVVRLVLDAQNSYVVKFFDEAKTLGYIELLLKENEVFAPATLPSRLPAPFYFRSHGKEYFHPSELPPFSI